jgi:hypothetical protein
MGTSYHPNGSCQEINVCFLPPHHSQRPFSSPKPYSGARRRPSSLLVTSTASNWRVLGPAVTWPDIEDVLSNRGVIEGRSKKGFANRRGEWRSGFGGGRAHGRDHPLQIRRRQVGAGGQAEAVAEEGFRQRPAFFDFV